MILTAPGAGAATARSLHIAHAYNATLAGHCVRISRMRTMRGQIRIMNDSNGTGAGNNTLGSGSNAEWIIAGSSLGAILMIAIGKTALNLQWPHLKPSLNLQFL